ncbi:MAG: carboxypeptidase regulatory-like domain-containing protein [Acidimicrobiales bacterium]|nr:carboxypeptidase regulatory-like domain-containing protein [Acidimicrobiales bacterium]
MPFAFNLGVTNFGPATANDVLLTVDIPPTLDIAIDDPSLDNCEHVDTQVECRWDSILAGSFRTDASLLLTARSLGEVRLTASVTSSTPEVDPDVESNQFGRTMSVLEAVPGDIRGSTEPDLAGTLVLAYRDRDGYVPTAFTVIGADGQFNLADIPGGRYRLLFYPPAGSGYALEWTFDQRTRADADRITLRGDGSSRVIGEQRLEAEATVTGSVESPSGGAIPAAAVALYRVESPWVPLMWVKTDTRGGFRFDRLPEGRYQIVATPPGGSSRWWGGPNRAGATVLDLGPGDEITAITFVF